MKITRISEIRKEFFFEKKYQISGDAIKDSESSTIYPVRCLCLPDCPSAILKIYHDRDITGLFRQLQEIHDASWAEIYDVDYFDTDTYVVEEYVPGVTLDALIYQKKRNHMLFTMQEISSFLTALCKSIRVLHRLDPPIIHRDLKPDNIILVTTYHNGKQVLDYHNIKIIDFDTVREYNRGQTRDTEFLGTRQYASPEQLGFATLGQTDARSDIYSIGIILYEMLYGELPTAENLKQLDPAQPFSNIILKCTQFQPEERFQSVDQLLDTLHNHPNEITSGKQKKKEPYIRFLSLKPLENPLLSSLLFGVLFGIGMGYHILLLVANLLFWFCCITTIILRAHHRGKYPQQFSVGSSVLYWTLFLLATLTVSIIVGLFFMPR